MEREQTQAVWLIIGQYGPAILSDAAVFRGLFYDYCPEARNRETELLMQSVGLGIARQIVLGAGKLVEHQEHQKMQQVLRQQAGASDQEARYIVDFWLEYAGKTVAPPIAATVVRPVKQAAPPVKSRKLRWLKKFIILVGLSAAIFVSLMLNIPNWLLTIVGIPIMSYILHGED